MLLPVFFATTVIAAATVPWATPSPPPIIITTKSSPLCTTVREAIAPAIVGMTAEDHLIGSANNLLKNMSVESVMGGGSWFNMDEVRLSTLVDHTAGNLTRINALIDQVGRAESKDPHDAAALETLRRRLQAVADRQAASLNLMSGIADSIGLNQIADSPGFGLHAVVGGKINENPAVTFNRTAQQTSPTVVNLNGAVGQTTSIAQQATPAPVADLQTSPWENDRRQIPLADALVATNSAQAIANLQTHPPVKNLFNSTALGSLAVDLGYMRDLTNSDEATVTPALKPIVNECR
jgi:hypothetical protein